MVKYLEKQCEHGLGTIRYLKAGIYQNWNARDIILKLITFRGCSTVNLILHSLLLNPKDKHLRIEVKKFEQYSDLSGSYEVIIDHSTHPESFKIHISRSLDITFEVEEWEYGGG